MPQEET